MYGFLLDRVSLSWVKGEKWRTPEGDPFVIFTIEEIRQRLRCSKPKAISLLAKLEEEELIKRFRPQKDGPYHIVVKSFRPKETEFDLGRAKYQTCTGSELLPAQVKKFDPNNTDNNKTDRNNTEKITLLERDIKKKIEYEILLSSYPKGQLDSVVEVMAQTLASPAKTIYMGGISMDAEVVKERLRKVGPGKIQYLFEMMEDYTEPIRSYRGFYLARLCDPEGAVDAYYERANRQACDYQFYVNQQKEPQPEATAASPFSTEYLQRFLGQADPPAPEKSFES